MTAPPDRIRPVALACLLLLAGGGPAAAPLDLSQKPPVASGQEPPPNVLLTIDLELGTGRVIKGWEQGLLGIKKGGKRRLTIPAALGYQDRGKGPIPPDTTLVFIVEAVDVRAPLPAPQGDEAFAGEPVAKKTKQGVEISTLAEGSGSGAKAGDLVSLHYTGKLDDGTVFDSSVPRKAPFKFMLGKGQVIEGWDIGIEGMKVGELRKLVIPADKAYGDRASGKIPANSTLTFHVEMMRIASGDK